MAQDVKHFVSSPDGSKGLRTRVPRTTGAMELNKNDKAQRSTLPSEEPIDLRNLFPENCLTFEHQGITHHLDDEARRYFVKQLKRYNQRYTQGVYDAVMKHASARLASGMYGKEESARASEEELTYKPPAMIPVGYSQHRGENRLNFATDVELELPDGNVIMARSVDISPSGMQVRLPNLIDVVNGMEFDIYFPALEEEFEQSFGATPYVLKASAIGSMYMTLKLARANPGSHPFDVFIEEFIEAKKYRYRVDAEDSKLAMTAKAWEYLYVKALPGLAAFVTTTADGIQIQELAISEQNQYLLKGLGHSMLSQLEAFYSKTRLKANASGKQVPDEIFACRYQGTGLRRRLIATSWQFRDDTQRQQFLRVCSMEDTFRAWRIQAIKLNEIPKLRSEELLHKLAEISEDQAESLIKQLNQHEYLLYLVDITGEIRRDPMLGENNPVEEPEDYFFDDFEIKRRDSADYTRLRLGIGKQRNEDRYIFQSPVTVHYYGEKFKGHTLDMSVNGLKIQLESNKKFQVRDSVGIDFNGLMKQFKSAKDLKNQSYRVAAVTPGGAVCLTRDYRVGVHKAASFIDKLIKKNQSKLPSCTGELWMSTKARLMETWLNQSLPSQAMLLTRSKNTYDVPYLLKGSFTDKLMAPFKIGKELYNLEQLMAIPKLREMVRNLQIADEPQSVEIYVHQKGIATEQSIPEIIVSTWENFAEDLSRAEYLQGVKDAPVMACYKLSMMKIPRLEKIELIDDIKMIRRNARHHLAEFEQEFKSMIAIVELVDITNMVFERYNLSFR